MKQYEAGTYPMLPVPESLASSLSCQASASADTGIGQEVSADRFGRRSALRGTCFQSYNIRERVSHLSTIGDGYLPWRFGREFIGCGILDTFLLWGPGPRMAVIFERHQPRTSYPDRFWKVHWHVLVQVAGLLGRRQDTNGSNFPQCYVAVRTPSEPASKLITQGLPRGSTGSLLRAY